MFVLGHKMLYKNWGGERLCAYGAKENAAHAAILYSASAQDPYNCSIVAGEYEGETLSHAFALHQQRFGYDRYGTIFPLMVDLVNAQKDDLSVQIHPTDAYAKQHLHMPFGKAESWYFLVEPETKQVYCALTSTKKQEVLDQIEQNAYPKLLRKVSIRQGDYLHIPSGVIHALTKGSLIYEVQQAHDVLYRFWDYDRLFDGKKRPLETEQSLKNLDLRYTPSPSPMHTGQIKEEHFVTLQLLNLAHSFTNTKTTFALLTILSAAIKTKEGFTISQGTSLLLFPGETLIFDGEALAMAAWPK